MKNITPRKIRPLYDGQTVTENAANIQQTINDASFCLLLIQDSDGYTINAFNDYEAIKSYAYTLHGAKINKNIACQTNSFVQLAQTFKFNKIFFKN